jgi:hypothetical protein
MRYLVYCASGTGGLFLTSVIANFLGMNINPKFSVTGHSHDMGYGNWNGAKTKINVCGDHWDINFDPTSKIFYVHQGPIQETKSVMADLKVILIDVDTEDYYNVTKLYVCKAWVDMLTEHEYTKWRGADWPEYSKTLIQNNEFIRNELIKGLMYNISNWMNTFDKSVVDYKINFKTVMGINDKSLAEELSKILNKPVTEQIKRLISEYQLLNKKLYFTHAQN